MNMAAWKLGPALASGCTAILKPAEQTPLTALYMGKLALEAGIPEGVLNVVPGFGPTAGAALVEHELVDKIAFTGEAGTAQIIKKATCQTMKRLSFELGGKSPNIFFGDVDLQEAVKGAFGAIFSNMGQNCCAGSRAFVHASIYDEFVERLATMASMRKVGDNFDEQTEHGAQIDQAQFEKILHYLDLGRSEGAVFSSGGGRVFEKGFFIAPTVLSDVKDEMAVAREEIFGPVVSVLKFESTEEVVKRANQTDFGLAAGVWTQDIGRAHAIADQIKSGTVWINCYNAVDPAAPFGGFKMSGLGRELGEQALDAYTETKTITVFKPSMKSGT
jgi:aldehyde dehydrogenase (NAD+)